MQGDSSIGKALSGIGDVIGAVAKGSFGVASINIEDQVRAKVDKERNPIIQAYEDISKRGGPTVGGTDPNAGLASTEEGPYIPQQLNQALQPMNNLTEAHNQGKLDAAYYNARLQGIVRDVKSQYPGYESVVDDKVKEITGIVPANALAAEVFKASQDLKSQAQKENDQIRTALISSINKGDMGPKTLEDFDNGRMNKYQALGKISEVTMLDSQNKKELQDIALNEARGKDIKTGVTQHADGYAGRFVSNRVGSMLSEAGGVGDLLKQIEAAQTPGGPQMKPQDMVNASNAFIKQKTLVETQLLSYYNTPREELGGKTIQGIIGSDKVKSTIADATHIFDTFQTNLGFEKQGLAVSAANFTHSLRDANLANVLPLSKGLQWIDVYSKIGGQAGVGAYMMYGGGQDTLSSEAKSLGDIIHLGPATGNMKSMNEGMTLFKDFAEKYPDQAKELPISFLVGGNINEAISAKTSPQVSANLLNSFFSKENKGFTKNFEEGDRMELWNMMTSKGVADKVVALDATNPGLKEKYVTWATEEYLNAAQGQFHYLQDQFSYARGVSTSFDIANSRIVFQDKYNEPGLQAEVSKMNTSLSNLRGVLEASGRNPEEAGMILYSALASSGFDPNSPKKQGFLGMLFNQLDPANASERFSNSAKTGMKFISDTIVPPAGSQELKPLLQRITQVESGNNPKDQAKTSSAGGRYGFIDSTWLETIQKNFPDEVKGMSKSQVLALKKADTPEALAFQDKVANVLTTENQNAIKRAGFEPDDGNTYLAHFAGSGGAIKILKADPSMSAAYVLGPAAVKANPWLRRFTADGLIHWAQNKGAKGQ